MNIPPRNKYQFTLDIEMTCAYFRHSLTRHDFLMSYPYKLEPRPYQKDALKRIYNKKRFFLAWEMGTGKTKAALDFLGAMFYHRKIGRALVIAPLSVLNVWEDEIKKNWSIDITYTTMRPRCADDWQKFQTVFVNYDYARVCVKELMRWAPDVVILDESHKIKNPHAKQAKMAHRLGAICRYAICLTGTPIGNRPLDLWSQFKFLVPGLLQPDYKDFKDRYMIPGGFGGYEVKKYRNLKELASVISPHVKSLKKKDYLSLPEKNFIEIPVEMGERARELYRSMEKDFVAAVNESTSIVAPIVLAKLTKLCQISGGFIRNTEDSQDHPIHRSKLEVLQGITDDLLEADVKRVVIYARFLWEIDEIKKLLAPNWVTYEVSGRVKDEAQRKLAQTMFTASGGAMICQIASGSLGLNLQAANYMIFYSVDYSFINFSQAQDRIHRSGQTLPCFYYMLLAKGTLDRRIYSILKGKRNVADQIMTLVKESQSHGS